MPTGIVRPLASSQLENRGLKLKLLPNPNLYMKKQIDNLKKNQKNSPLSKGSSSKVNADLMDVTLRRNMKPDTITLSPKSGNNNKKIGGEDVQSDGETIAVDNETNKVISPDGLASFNQIHIVE